MSWSSAPRRPKHQAAEAAELSRRLDKMEHLLSGQAMPSAPPVEEVARDSAMMRVDLARFQNLVERAGWMPGAEPRQLWRWRNGWWELAHRKRNPRDGHPDTGWYLWGPPESYFGQWTAATKSGATRVADKLITMHFTAAAKESR
ncbi:hypothetical protein [Streptomyces sp. NPDC057623]|uniref:hypothetical protein n=1 Tax=Streptomyces sp. NPDC057623 TaxID=3346187 RepID=UPI0036765523